jgi:CRISPR-associated protein Cmr1
VIGDSNLDELHRLESAVFGSTDFGSPIQLRLRGNLKSHDEKILPHKEGREAGQRRAFDAQQSFTLEMFQLRSKDANIWRAACAALSLALMFGGVGLRSRRGYGTLRIVQSSNSDLEPMPQTLGGWRKYVEQTTTNAMQAVRALAGVQNIVSLPERPTRYPCANTNGMIRICDLKTNDAMDAVKQLMLKTHSDRAFGGISPRRQASPLWVRVIQTEKGCGLLMVVIASSFENSNYDRVRNFLHNFDGYDISVKGWNA